MLQKKRVCINLTDRFGRKKVDVSLLGFCGINNLFGKTLTFLRGITLTIREIMITLWIILFPEGFKYFIYLLCTCFSFQ